MADINLPPRPRSGLASTVLATLALLVGLWWAQSFLIPLVTGLMLAMLVAPMAGALARWLHSRLAAAALTLLLVLATLVVTALSFGGQLLRVAERVPQMISMAAQQVSARDPTTRSLLGRAQGALRELDRAADRLLADDTGSRRSRRATTAAATAAANLTAPAQGNNNIAEGATEALRESAVSGSSQLLSLAADLSLALFVSFFVLTGGPTLTRRFLALWGRRRDVHHRAACALLECSRQVRLYAGVLLLTNSAIGVLVWAAFSWAGLPDAAGWGVAAAVLHVVPYLGMTVLTLLGAADTFLVYQTGAAALAMAAFVVALSTLIGTLVTAALQARSAKMNPAAVFVGLMFWGALWGVWGLFLGPVLVVLLKVVLEHARFALPLAKLMQG